MLLAIDAGNTNIVFALFDGAKSMGTWRAATNAQRTADEYAVFLRGAMREEGLDPAAVKAAIIGSVVPEANFNLTKLCREYFDCDPLMIGDPKLDTGIRILIDRPEEIGADRIINAVGGAASYKPPLLIVDFGTATTFDVVDADGNYCGGAIAPGVNLSLQALHMAAAKLPRVGIAPAKRVIGKNTVDAMQSGIFWGYVGLIEGMIARVQKEFGLGVTSPDPNVSSSGKLSPGEVTPKPMTVIATGGLAPLFKDAVAGINHSDGDLTLRGLYEIYRKNNPIKT